MPVFNAAPTVARAVRSVVAQTEPRWELVVVDDGSTDGSAEVVRVLAAADPRVVVLGQAHRGHVAARQAGFAASQTPIVTFLDADDWYTPAHLARNLAYLTAHPEADATSGTATILGDPYVLDMRDRSQYIHLDECAMHGTFFIRRPVLEALSPMPDDDYGADYLLHQRMLQAGYVVHRLNFRTYVYDRRAERSVSKDVARSRAAHAAH